MSLKFLQGGATPSNTPIFFFALISVFQLIAPGYFKTYNALERFWVLCLQKDNLPGLEMFCHLIFDFSTGKPDLTVSLNNFLSSCRKLDVHFPALRRYCAVVELFVHSKSMA